MWRILCGDFSHDGGVQSRDGMALQVLLGADRASNRFFCHHRYRFRRDEPLEGDLVETLVKAGRFSMWVIDVDKVVDN